MGRLGAGVDNTPRDVAQGPCCSSALRVYSGLLGAAAWVSHMRLLPVPGSSAPRHVGPPPQVGGWVTDGRVCGILAVSRAFGDREYKGEGLQHLLERGVASGRWTAEFAAGRCVAEGREAWCVARHGRCPAATVDSGWEGRGSLYAASNVPYGACQHGGRGEGINPKHLPPPAGAACQPART